MEGAGGGEDRETKGGRERGMRGKREREEQERKKGKRTFSF